MTPDAEALLNKARESLEAARLLNSEGFPNFAASRAYYAMFYAAEALLLDKGLSYSSHSAVTAALGREFVKTGVLDSRFHRYLIDAQDLRNIGDYDLYAQVTDVQVSKLLSWGEELIAEAERILTQPR